MPSLFLKLLALTAYIAMPFTMSVAMSAPAAGQAHHEAMMAMDHMVGMNHRSEQNAPEIDHTAFIGCAMMCAAMPAADVGEPEPVGLARPPLTPPPVKAYSGIHLEIATPPPRLA
jgi:hypothetical protein